jgi:transcriptional regulator with GAF, ATPase, and Fis domain
MRRGKFELADNGTLFLDEIGDLHANSQAKLLRVLQEGEFHRVGGEQSIRVTVRVLSATNRDPERDGRPGQVPRRPLLPRERRPIRVPALRERPQDIRPMAEYFLDDFCARNGFRQKRFDPEVWDAFENCKWPGNARELRNAVERMAILSAGDVLTAAAIPLELRCSGNPAPRSSVQEARESAEREHVLRALEESAGTCRARRARSAWSVPRMHLLQGQAHGNAASSEPRDQDWHLSRQVGQAHSRAEEGGFVVTFSSTGESHKGTTRPMLVKWRSTRCLQ